MDDLPRCPPLVSAMSTPAFSDLPPPPRLASTRSTPVTPNSSVEVLREMSRDDIEAHRIGRDFLRTGRQVFTPLTLQRIASGDGDIATNSDIPGYSSSALQAVPEEGQSQLSVEDMFELIVNETEMVLSPGEYDVEVLGSTEQTSRGVCCIVCYDDLDSIGAAYQCDSDDCAGALCQNCLYRQVDVTIRNALYAVPRIRCPGTCMRRISTAIWRGALHDAEVPTDDSPSTPDAKPLSELINSIVLRTDSFMEKTPESCTGDLCEMFDSVGEVLKKYGLSFVQVYASARDLGIISSEGSEVRESVGDDDAVLAAPASSASEEKSEFAPVERRRESRGPRGSFEEFAYQVFPHLPMETEGVAPNSFDTTMLVEHLHAEVIPLGFADEEVPADTIKSVLCFFLAQLAVCIRIRPDVVRSFTQERRRRRSLDVSSAESSLMKRYSDNAEALMAMRCGGCDETTGLFHSETNSKVVVSCEEDRRRVLREVSSGLDHSSSEKFLKALLDFNAGTVTSEACVAVICEVYEARVNGPISSVKCPKGHVMMEGPLSGNWACDGKDEVQGCASGAEVTDQTARWRCEICDHDYCALCYTARKDNLDRYNARSSEVAVEEKSSDESKTTDDDLINRDGIRTVISLDDYHTRQERHYCGRAIGQRGYFNGPCRGCNGSCGPSSGCQCTACFLMDNPDAARPRSDDPKLLEPEGWEFIGNILSLFVDIERRCALQLEIFRKYPKISTPCCGQRHCFLCKVTGHHPGRSCDEVQRSSFGQECQYCPACGVPTLRTEGCDHIICPCGRNWHWDNDRPSHAAEAPPMFGGALGQGARNPFGDAFAQVPRVDPPAGIFGGEGRDRGGGGRGGGRGRIIDFGAPPPRGLFGNPIPDGFQPAAAAPATAPVVAPVATQSGDMGSGSGSVNPNSSFLGINPNQYFAHSMHGFGVNPNQTIAFSGGLNPNQGMMGSAYMGGQILGYPHMTYGSMAMIPMMSYARPGPNPTFASYAIPPTLPVYHVNFNSHQG